MIEHLLGASIKLLWLSAGVCTATIGVVTDTGWAVRLVTILAGIITILLSILLGGFIKHLSGHSEHTRELHRELAEMADQLQNKEQCETFRDSLEAIFKAELSAIHTEIAGIMRELKGLCRERRPK
jgi:hypothetical protein